MGFFFFLLKLAPFVRGVPLCARTPRTNSEEYLLRWRLVLFGVVNLKLASRAKASDVL